MKTMGNFTCRTEFRTAVPSVESVLKNLRRIIYERSEFFLSFKNSE